MYGGQGQPAMSCSSGGGLGMQQATDMYKP